MCKRKCHSADRWAGVVSLDSTCSAKFVMDNSRCVPDSVQPSVHNVATNPRVLEKIVSSAQELHPGSLPLCLDIRSLILRISPSSRTTCLSRYCFVAIPYLHLVVGACLKERQLRWLAHWLSFFRAYYWLSQFVQKTAYTLLFCFV